MKAKALRRHPPWEETVQKAGDLRKGAECDSDACQGLLTKPLCSGRAFHHLPPVPSYDPDVGWNDGSQCGITG